MRRLLINVLVTPGSKRRAVLRATGRGERVSRSARSFTPACIFRVLTLLVLLLVPLPNRANPGAVHLPFRTVQSMILVEGRIGGQRMTFVLDTGANHTIVSVRSYGAALFLLRRAQRNHGGAGMTGESIRLPVNLTLADHTWVGQPVSVMDLDDLQQALGINFDGLLGQDILREFRSVRIDYHAHVIELEQ